MSVIDKMLRDLDARGARGAGRAAGAGELSLAAPAGGASGAPGISGRPSAGAASGGGAPEFTIPELASGPRRSSGRTLRLAALGVAGAAAIGITAFADIGTLAGGPSHLPTPVAVVEPAATSTAPAAAPTSQAAAPASAEAPAGLAQTQTAATAHETAVSQGSAAPAVGVPAAPATLATPATRAHAARTVPEAAQVAPVAVASASTSASTSAPTSALALAPAAPTRRAGPATPAAPAAPAATAELLAPARPGAEAVFAPPTPSRIDKRAHAPSPEQRLAQLHRQAVEAAQAGQRHTAIAKALELLAIEPRHGAARQLAAALEHEAGAPARAAELLREGLALSERGSAQAAALALPLARLLAAQGLADEALQVLDEYGLAAAEAQGLRAGVLARRGDYAAALPAYEAAARAQPLQPMWWLGLGVALESLGEPARARQAFAKAQAIGLPREDLAAYVELRLRALE